MRQAEGASPRRRTPVRLAVAPSKALCSRGAVHGDVRDARLDVLVAVRLEAERGVQRLEDCALARAIDGVPEWKTDRDGGLITYGVKHNKALVMFFLHNRRPERYSEHIRPGHPVYERIRREVEAGLPAAAAEDREAPCEGETDSRECALSRHFADRLAQVGPDGTAVVAGDGEAPAQLFLDKAGTKADLVRSRGRGANSRSRDSRQGETK